MSEREDDFGVEADAEARKDSPATGDSPAVTGWEAWDTTPERAVAPSAPHRHGLFDGLQPPWLPGALSALLVVLAAAAAFVAARGGFRAPLDARGLVALGFATGCALALAALAGWAISTLAARYQSEHQRHRALLARLGALDLDSESGWQDPALRAEGDLLRFLDAVRARDRLQRLALVRAAVLEGELTRLGKGLLDGERSAVIEAYEMPLVGRAASGAALLHEEIDRLRMAQVELESRLHEAGGQATNAAAEARRWQAQAGGGLGALQAALQRVGSDTQRLAGAFAEKLCALEEIERRGVPSLIDVRDALPAVAAGAQAGQLTQTAHAIKDLVARGGSLAIQTALEVTRLGERGETLFPLTESLKSLVTEFQSIATRLEKAARDQEMTGSALARAQAQMDEIAAASGRDIPEPEAWRRGAARAGDLRTALVRVGADADALVQAFAEQGTRLEALAGALFELTGVPCETSADTAPVVGAGGFEIESFGGPALGPEKTVVAVQAPASPAPAPAASPPPAAFRLFDVDEAPAPATAAPVRPLSGSIFAPEEPRFDAGETLAPTAPAVPTEEDRIYDLVEFGAVALDASAAAPATPPAMDGDDHIYDLCELGAVALG
jgi:hypothetical protein